MEVHDHQRSDRIWYLKKKKINKTTMESESYYEHASFANTTGHFVTYKLLGKFPQQAQHLPSIDSQNQRNSPLVWAHSITCQVVKVS